MQYAEIINHGNNLVDGWEIIPFAVIAIALFTFIMMLALISNTSSIEKQIKEIRESLEKQGTNQTSESDK